MIKKTTLFFFAVLFLPLTARISSADSSPFTAVRQDANFVLPPIVFPHDEVDQEPFDWSKLSQTSQAQQRYKQVNPAVDAVRYLREAVQRMTGHELPVVSREDISSGIILITLSAAPPDIRNDPQIQKALLNIGEDAYNANEAFYVRTEPHRILIVANTPEGLGHGVVALLESVGYEVLGMGPDWTYVPDFHEKPLIFSMERAGRPGFYIRELGPTSGQGFGIGTLFGKPLPDPSDEPVEVSYNRWSIGTRIVGTSMPRFPGNIFQKYHRAVVDKMKEAHSAAGFLTVTQIGPDSARPPANTENKGHVWINEDKEIHATMFVSDGKTWIKQAMQPRGVKLDLSVPLVREILLDDLKKKSTAYFAQKHQNPRDQIFVFATEPEDGVQPMEFQNNPNWYPEYLKSQRIPFGKPYVLNGFKGLNQPKELWDPKSYSDTVFGFNNWLLHEYDRWIDSLPSTERVTKDGKSKKQMVRASLYSYSAHDVPPDFNLDPRIRVMIAGYPKHRGHGKWKNFVSQIDMAQAFHVLLPREPSGDYWITSLSYYRDFGKNGIGGSKLAATIQHRIKNEYDAGFRALSMECDFNFGKLGLEYYLYAKMLWNPQLTAQELEAIRIRWLQRAFGSGWREMKEYYDFMAPENYPVNWAKAIRFIDAADKKIDGTKEPSAQRRLDDLKQYWYFYYLCETGQDEPASKALREFVWKGQMSYMTAMHMVLQRLFHSHDARAAAGPEFNTGPAHYTHAETQVWWAKVLDHWKFTPVAEFADSILSNGERGRDVDTNDLVLIQQFKTSKPFTKPSDVPFSYSNGSYFYNTGVQRNITFLTVAQNAGDEVGFKYYWPYKPDDNNFRAKRVYYGISRWDETTKRWQVIADIETNSQQSHAVTDKNSKVWQLVDVRSKVLLPGTYRIEVGYGGIISSLAPLNYNVVTGQLMPQSGLSQGMSYCTILSGITQSPTYIYIPKGTKSFDLEVWGPDGAKKLWLHGGLPATGLTQTRVVDVSTSGTHTVKLNPGEDGSIAVLKSNGFYFPHLYSVPMLWAKSPSLLLVPRDIARSDGLAILK